MGASIEFNFRQIYKYAQSDTTIMALSTLFYILWFTLLGSVCGLIGGVLLLFWKRKLVQKSMLYVVSFAIGALLGAAFLDLIPEAIELGNAEIAMIWVFGGLLVFFILENFVRWHFCHELICKHKGHKHVHPRPFSYLLIFGDTFHNFIDGVIIAAAFLIDVPLGIITAVAVFFHEIPQEIADFGVLLYAKMPRTKIVLYNLFSAFAAFVGAIGTYLFAPDVSGLVPALAAFAAGGFIYIALADLAPETHAEDLRARLPEVIARIAFVFVGIGVIWGLGKLLGV